MSSIINLSSQQLRHIANLKEKIDILEHELSRLIGGGGVGRGRGRRKFKMSAAGRARIAAAQRARWAKINGKKKPAKGTKGRRKMNAAAKAKIAAAARARWAKAKAAGKNRL